ncbi:hypothetical protein [Nonomuraea jabiensis]|uniref:hypothetical protein n=1 Tax=Nonomuraea jabiensis TaxID=882448 RepID=UPI003D7459E2
MTTKLRRHLAKVNISYWLHGLCREPWIVYDYERSEVIATWPPSASGSTSHRDPLIDSPAVLFLLDPAAATGHEAYLEDARRGAEWATQRLPATHPGAAHRRR